MTTLIRRQPRQPLTLPEWDARIACCNRLKQVKEYVIIDRFERRVTVLRRGRGRFAESELGPRDAYTTSLLPGLKIPLKEIL